MSTRVQKQNVAAWYNETLSFINTCSLFHGNIHKTAPLNIYIGLTNLDAGCVILPITKKYAIKFLLLLLELETKEFSETE